jgi:hypothetical protein
MAEWIADGTASRSDAYVASCDVADSLAGKNLEPFLEALMHATGLSVVSIVFEVSWNCMQRVLLIMCVCLLHIFVSHLCFHRCFHFVVFTSVFICCFHMLFSDLVFVSLLPRVVFISLFSHLRFHFIFTLFSLRCFQIFVFISLFSHV